MKPVLLFVLIGTYLLLNGSLIGNNLPINARNITPLIINVILITLAYWILAIMFNEINEPVVPITRERVNLTELLPELDVIYHYYKFNTHKRSEKVVLEDNREHLYDICDEYKLLIGGELVEGSKRTGLIYKHKMRAILGYKYDIEVEEYLITTKNSAYLYSDGRLEIIY